MSINPGVAQALDEPGILVARRAAQRLGEFIEPKAQQATGRDASPQTLATFTRDLAVGQTGTEWTPQDRQTGRWRQVRQLPQTSPSEA